MSNYDLSDPADDLLHLYPEDSRRATLSLHAHLIKLLHQHQSISFDRFMEACLYHPQFGYYTRGDERVGREGDFFTSVSVGACFGMLLAHRILNYVADNQSTTIHIIEMGANTGQLAADILDCLQAQAPAIHSRICYTLIEPLAGMQKKQCQTLHQHLSQIKQVASLAELAENPIEHGIFISNELIDAFPFRLIARRNAQWLERRVCSDIEHRLAWCEAPIAADDPLHAFTSKLPSDLPDGYLSEARTSLPAFSQQCAQAMLSGLIITIDYGHTHTDYFSPHRTTGTLRTFQQHEAAENPLISLGEQDITAHVDFSDLAECLSQAGYNPTYFDTQSRYLTHYATQWMQQIEASGEILSPKLIRQFQTLTHPAMMGRQFHVLECQKPAIASPETLTKLGLKS